MKIVQINTVPNGSTGTIMMNIHKELLEQGHESYVVWGRGRKSNNSNEIYMNDKLGVYFHALYSRITGNVGFASKRATKKLIKKLDKIKPNIIHLHNIHGYYINIELLFNYIKQNNIRVVWTLHDCWAFTGHCCYFDMVNCKKWENKCEHCPQLRAYPKTFFDNSLRNYQKKKRIFLGVKDLTIVTPSEWLKNNVRKSFLNYYNSIVINNGIDISIFRQVENKENQFKKNYDLINKKIILGVASDWSERKGLKDFVALSSLLTDKYKIVLVGLSDNQIKKLPSSIIGLPRTKTIDELVNIYNSADIFFNPTYEDNYPTVNLEAVACGLKIITYDTGGSKESAFLTDNSINLINKSNIKQFLSNFERRIDKVEESRCRECIDKKYMVKKYIETYLLGSLDSKI